ncbi:MAG: hypothetical protein ABIP48_28425 [Planctomycetota bacterium]
MPDCINLKERFGDRFKIDVDESYYAERPEFRKAEEPWLQLLLCRHGHICPWGGSQLAACTNGRGPVANRLKALPFTTVAQEGDDGVNVLFDVAHFDQVAEIMKPRLRRRLSPEQRQRLAVAGAKYRFSPGAQHAGEGQFRTFGPDGGDEAPLQPKS